MSCDKNVVQRTICCTLFAPVLNYEPRPRVDYPLTPPILHKEVGSTLYATRHRRRLANSVLPWKYFQLPHTPMSSKQLLSVDYGRTVSFNVHVESREFEICSSKDYLAIVTFREPSHCNDTMVCAKRLWVYEFVTSPASENVAVNITILVWFFSKHIIMTVFDAGILIQPRLDQYFSCKINIYWFHMDIIFNA